MASINANTTSGLIQTGDLSGTLLLQGNGYTGITITATGIPQAATVATNTSTIQIATTAFANPGAVNGTTSGYHKLPSGVILQWGSAGTATATGTAITLLTTFPTACISVVLTGNAAANNTAATAMGVTAKTASSFTWVSENIGTGLTATYIAIGY